MKHIGNGYHIFTGVGVNTVNHFTISQPLPSIYHIEDISKVCFTLVKGQRDTLLWDTGLGLYDVAACIAPYVHGTLHVVLSHGHYDHACGHHYFSEVLLHPEDLQLCKHAVAEDNRAQIVNRVKGRGFLDETFDPLRYQSHPNNVIRPIQKYTLDLGGISVRFIPTAGHTKGSMVAFIPEYKLLLTGDMWNPHTWLFFPESQPLSVYTQSMKSIRDLQAEAVLCSHDIKRRTMRRLRTYIDGLHDNTFAKAKPCTIPPYTHINTYCCRPEPQSLLVFNGDKR